MDEKHPDMKPAYAAMKPIQRADLFRYLVLLEYGGYYSDVDVNCLEPIERWIGQYHPEDTDLVALLVGFEIVTNKKAVANHYYAREFQLVQWTIPG